MITSRTLSALNKGKLPVQIKSCGVDLIEVGRIAKAIQKERFHHRIYTFREREELKTKSAQSWAARFAAKEAVMKALGRGFGQGVSFQEIEIRQDRWGKPTVHLQGPTLKLAEMQGIRKMLLSLSHTKDLAIAYVIALGEE